MKAIILEESYVISKSSIEALIKLREVAEDDEHFLQMIIEFMEDENYRVTKAQSTGNVAHLKEGKWTVT